MERYLLNETDVQAPKGIDGLTRRKARSRRYFSMLYKNIGYANGVGNVTFADPVSRKLLTDLKRQSGVQAVCRFRVEIDGVTQYDAYINFLTMSSDQNGVTCSFWDDATTTTLENQATTTYSVPTSTSITLRPKQITGATTHTIDSATATVQASWPSAKSLNHALPLLRPDKSQSTLPGQLLTVESPAGNSPIYRNTTTDPQALRVSGRVWLTASVSATASPKLVVQVYESNGQSTEVWQGDILVNTTPTSYTLLLGANLLVQPGGWVVIGFRSETNVTKYSFVYSTDSVITLESSNQAPASLCRGIMAFDLLSELISRTTEGKLDFASDYFSTGAGASVFLTSGANLRGLNRPVTTTLQNVFEGLTASDPLALWIENGTVYCEPLLSYLKQVATHTVIDTELINISYKTNADYVASEVLTGFETWRGSGPLSGDEINGSRQYLTLHKTVRQTLDLRAKTLIASGTLIEEQRRKQFSDRTASSSSADSSDALLYLINVTTDRTGAVVNETREKTPYLTSVADAETPCNIRLSPRRSLERWAKILPLAPLTLESAEGNARAESRYVGESDVVSENAPLASASSLLGVEQAIVTLPMFQPEFNTLGDWLTVYDQGAPVTGLVMDASWRTDAQQGPICEAILFLYP